jgi:hypothetical protein
MSDEASVFIGGVLSPAELESFQQGRFIAIHHRNGSSICWGVFDSIEEVRAWVKQHGVVVQILRINDPNGNPDAWM